TVFKFLDNASKAGSSWNSDPLWHVVDGPFHLRSHNPATGDTVMVKNAKYTGPDRARVAGFELLSFTSNAAETAALLAGQLSYGYLPVTSLGLKSRLIHQGYYLAPWVTLGIGWQYLNYTDSKVGPILKHLYIRQAMQHLVDQTQII